MITLLVQTNMEHSLQVVDQWKGFISDIHDISKDKEDAKAVDKVGYASFHICEILNCAGTAHLVCCGPVNTMYIARFTKTIASCLIYLIFL